MFSVCVYICTVYMYIYTYGIYNVLALDLKVNLIIKKHKFGPKKPDKKNM